MAKHLPRVQAGETFGRLTAIGPPIRSGRYLKVPVVCTCGTRKTVEQAVLRRGSVNSCGCLNQELLKVRSETHGMSKSPVYAVWNSMRQRCENPDNKQFSDYGGRGISVCVRWQTFENFYEDMGLPPFKGATIDRRDNEKGYDKENCRWATRQVNNLNRRNTVRYHYLGADRTLAEIADLTGINYSTLYQRVHTYKWPIEKAADPRPGKYASRTRNDHLPSGVAEALRR